VVSVPLGSAESLPARSKAIIAGTIARAMPDWKRLSGRVVYRRGAFRIVEDRWQLPDGTRQVFPVLKSPSFAIVVALTAEHEVPLVENLHPSPGLRLLELPGGRIDRNETARSAARRELEEETGWRARRLALLGRYFPNPHWGSFEGHVFFGEGLTAGPTHPDEGESLRPLLMPVREVYRRFHRGGFRGGSSIVALSLAEERFRTMGLLSNATRTR
jgi:ADP-ribose pyrophosphatase